MLLVSGYLETSEVNPPPPDPGLVLFLRSSVNQHLFQSPPGLLEAMGGGGVSDL